MSKTPKEIWCRSGLYYEYVKDWSEGSWSPTNDGGVKYVRTDTIPDPAAIWREAMEAALSSLNDTGMYWTGLREGQLFQREIEKIRAIPNPYEVKE